MPGDVAEINKIVIAADYTLINLEEFGSVVITPQSKSHRRVIRTLKRCKEDNVKVYLNWVRQDLVLIQKVSAGRKN